MTQGVRKIIPKIENTFNAEEWSRKKSTNRYGGDMTLATRCNASASQSRWPYYTEVPSYETRTETAVLWHRFIPTHEEQGSTAERFEAAAPDEVNKDVRHLQPLSPSS